MKFMQVAFHRLPLQDARLVSKCGFCRFFLAYLLPRVKLVELQNELPVFESNVLGRKWSYGFQAHSAKIVICHVVKK